MTLSYRSVVAIGFAVLLGGCAVEAAPQGLGMQPLKGDASAVIATRTDGTVGHVTIDSRYGHGTISGPVRRGARNLEVRMPGGTWLDCGRNCGETLRRETVDFWENHSGGRDAPADGPGYLTWSR
jgi:hypothetical protein